ncbi:MAG: hypothetical protein ACTTGJ_00500 [Clostridium sp.]
MGFKKYNYIKSDGITLVTLVLTIIILLILSALVITLSLGDNGLLQRARRINREQIVSEEKDKIISIYGGILAENKGKYDASLLEKELQKDGSIVTVLRNVVTYHHEKQGYNNIYTLDTIDGKIVKYREKTIVPLPATLEVGDTVIYDPTRDVKDNSLLTYTSEKGTAKTGGNGFGKQVVKAKSSNNEWIVLSKANNQLKVMSKEVIFNESGGKGARMFAFQGGIGWLYLEEEIHKACSVFGHGKGAEETITEYRIGNPYIEGEAKTRTITGSGARSITMVDIVKIMKGDQYENFTDDEKKQFSNTYNEPTLKSRAVVYPTITSDREDGASETKQSFKREFYDIDKNNGEYDRDLVTDNEVKKNKEKLKEHIFKNREYWLDKVCLDSRPHLVHFRMFFANVNNITGNFTYYSDPNLHTTAYSPACYLRPVVYLDGSMIEETSPGSKVWRIK